jgi:N-formylmaleamate deformylase
MKRMILAAALLATTSTAVHAQTPPPFEVQRHGSGRAMIFIPGLMSHGDVWTETARHYAKTHDVHVITLAGFAGAKPLSSDSFLKTGRDAILAYIKKHELEKPVIVGHSLGGFMAFSLAATAPDIIGPIVAVDGVPFISALRDSAATEAGSMLQAKAIRTMYESFTPEQVAAQTQVGAANMTLDSVAGLRIVEWARTSHPRTTAAAIAEMLTTDLRDDVAAIRSPVLLIGAGNGMNEAMQTQVKQSYARQLARIPNARLEWFAQSRHFIMFDEPARLVQTIDAFLSAQ